jgi:hypothetical protein
VRAVYPAVFKRKVDAGCPGIQIPHHMDSAIPETSYRCAAAGTNRFF